MRYGALLATMLMAVPVQAFGPYPYEQWRFILEFRRMPMAPTCWEKFGKGTFVQTKKGRNPAYELTGFPDASIIRCSFPNGGEFDINAARMFDLPDDGVWKGTVELMGPGDIREVRARYTFKIGPFVDGTFWFETKKGQIKQAGGSIDMYKAMTTGARF